jgi:mono/diheme cytochrome c family protein
MSIKNRFGGWTLVIGLLSLLSCNMNEGKRTYQLTCGNCHMEGGQGLTRLIPAFKEATFKNNRHQMICKIIHGVNDSITGDFMPPYGFMDDAQISNILNYITRLKDYDVQPFTDREVVEARESCK